MTRRERLVRYLRARGRFVRLVTRGFKIEIALIASILLGAGLMIEAFHPSCPHFVKSLHAAMALFTLQQELDFPDPLPGAPLTLGLSMLQVLWFALPVVGVTIVAETLVRLGVVVFNRERGREEWQVAVASTMKDHVVVIGFGHIGYRVVGQIAPRDPRIVVVEKEPREEYAHLLERWDIPMIPGDARRDDTLEKCGIARARALLALTDNDLVNLEAALNAREKNPSIKVVLRMFDEGLAARLERAFDFQAVFSTTALAAPSFAAALWNSKILHSMTVGEAQLHLARFVIGKESPLVGLSIAQIEARHAVNVLLHQSAQKTDVLPSAQSLVAPGDIAYIVAELDGLDAFDVLTGGPALPRRASRRPRALDADGRAELALRLEEQYDARGAELERDARGARARGRALEALDLRAGHRLLEVGAGTGLCSAKALARFAGGHVVALDQGARLLKRARERCAGAIAEKRFSTTRADALRLPFRDEAFDRVLSVNMLELLDEEDVGQSLHEMRRVLKPGGLVALAGLTRRGASPLARLVASGVGLARRVNPLWTGGSRPLDLEPLARHAGLRILHREVVEEHALPSEVLVATR